MSFLLLTLLLPMVLSIPTSGPIISLPSNVSDLYSRSTDDGQLSGLQILMFFDSGCSSAGGSTTVTGINYGTDYPCTITQNEGTFPTLSYYLSRDLLPGEQLDWSIDTAGAVPSQYVTNQDCGTFLQSAPNEAKSGCIAPFVTSANCICYELKQGSTCYRLWKH